MVAEAANGAEAVAAVCEHAPDVVVMDLHMPVLDGIGAIRALTAAGSPAAVLAFSASDEPGEAQEALEAGAYAFVRKTAPVEELVAAARAAAASVRAARP